MRSSSSFLFLCLIHTTSSAGHVFSRRFFAFLSSLLSCQFSVFLERKSSVFNAREWFAWAGAADFIYAMGRLECSKEKGLRSMETAKQRGKRSPKHLEASEDWMVKVFLDNDKQPVLWHDDSQQKIPPGWPWLHAPSIQRQKTQNELHATRMESFVRRRPNRSLYAYENSFIPAHRSLT